MSDDGVRILQSVEEYFGNPRILVTLTRPFLSYVRDESNKGVNPITRLLKSKSGIDGKNEKAKRVA